MVSTRGPKYKFSDGEKVLCYEPDPTKAKVLYDSKVLEVSEGRDKRGRRVIEYLIHFQGWNSSWDRKVSEDFILKDTDENRQLQKDLAEKSQLHQGTYLYRKERKKHKDKSLSARIESLTAGAHKVSMHQQPFPPHPMSQHAQQLSHPNQQHQLPAPLLSDDALPGPSSNIPSTLGLSRPDEPDFHLDAVTLDGDTEYYSSSVESSHEEDKVYLQVGAKLKRFLEFDYRMISDNILTKIPAQLPVVTILENFVRHYTIRQLFDLGQEQAKLRRRNSSFLKGDQKTKDYEAIRINVDLCKEVADGLRLYFDFTLKDHLLYAQEKYQAELVLSDAYLANFTYVVCPNLSLELLAIRLDSPTVETGTDHIDATLAGSSTAAQEEKKRRRLRSHKNEENEFLLDLSIIKQESFSPGNTQSLAYSLLKSAFPSNITISFQTKEILEDVFSWKLLPSDAPAEPSMIYGAVHLARLIIKLPEFLSVTTMGDEKLKLLLKFLDSFSEFIEEHEEWFSRDVYSDKCLLGDVVKLENPAHLGPSCIQIKEEDLDLHGSDGMMAGPLLSDVKVENTTLLQ
ncbi:protein male-specific lethal-3 [Uranotaenia lowii]|uniref:protein male-specific lethal-3 n=1 Tax=Uranotaenia lowii TaxID=190385 RepID=UPI00247AE81A|nr:protein male-specific lethal-3 [Uranotaenia lowii]